MTFDPSSAAFLESLQRDLLGAEPAQDDQTEVARLLLAQVPEAEREVVLAALNQPRVPTPTPYESPSQYPILCGLADDILSALAEDIELPEAPLVGSLPVGWSDPVLLRVPDSARHLAVVDPQFSTFANLLAKACAQALALGPGEPGSEPWAAGLQDPEHPGMLRYIDLVMAAVHADPSHASAYWPDSSWHRLADALRTAIEVFVLADPLVHLALGHPDTAPVRPLAHIHPRCISYEWDQRQRTKAFVMRLAAVAAVLDRHGHERRLGYWGIEMYLRTLVLIEGLKAQAKRAEPPDHTRAQEALRWFRPLLAHFEGEESPSLRILATLEPASDAFERWGALALEADGS